MGNAEYMGTHPIFESDFDCLTDYGLEHPLKWLLVKISVLPKEKREARRRSLIHSPRRNGTRSRPHLFSRTETLVKLWSPDQPVPSWLLMVSEDVSTRLTKPISMVTNPPTENSGKILRLFLQLMISLHLDWSAKKSKVTTV